MAEREIDLEVAIALLAVGPFNLLIRGDDGSLVMSADKWRSVGVVGDVVRFEAVDPAGGAPPPRDIPLLEVARISWDRLPRQQVRSQVRFRLRNGDLLTFSGTVDETALPADD